MNLKFILPIFITFAAIIVFADSAVVEDFTDVGTWRVRLRHGNTPGTWFSESLCLTGGSDKERPDGYKGIVDYDFSGKEPYILGFERYKPYQTASVFADAVTFAANGNGKDFEIFFYLEDSNHKVFKTPHMKINGNTWKDYSISLANIEMEQPVRIKQVAVQFRTPGQGQVFIDDLALKGDVSRRNLVTVKPVYNGIGFLPTQEATREYLVRNSSDKQLKATVKLDVFSFDDKKVFSGKQDVSIAPEALIKVCFTIGKLPIGSYYTKAVVKNKRINNSFEGWFGVFTPNGGRLNKRPMFFGVQDTTSWNGKTENSLHMTWLKALGMDIVRYGTTGGRFQPKEDVNGFKDFDKQLKPFKDADILVCMSYCESTPEWLQNPPYHHRRLADKPEKLAKHMQDIGSFLRKYPNIQYFEFWNEPDLNFLQDSFENYLESLKTVYKNLKKVNPYLKVITGGVTIKHPKEKKNFSRDMYQKGKGYYDVANFHAHGSLDMYIERDLTVEKWLKEKNIDLPLSNTETGSRSGYVVKSIKQQADALVKKITFAKSRKTEFYIWFTLQDYWDMDNGDDSFGLVTCDNQPKPSFLAYNNLIKHLANTSPAAIVELDEKLKTYRFKRDDGMEVFVSWPNVPEEKMLLTINSKVPVTFSNIFGREKVIDSEIGKIMISDTAHPFYLIAPWGSISRGTSILSVLPSQGAAPGEICNLKITLNNPFDKDTELKLSGPDVVKPLTLTVAAEKSLDAVIPVKVNRKTFGLFDTVIDVTGGEKLFNVPVSINAAYVVVNKNHHPNVITVNERADVHELTFDPSIPQWGGAQDLSCTASAIHDGKGIQFLFKVTDDKHIAKHKDVNIWKNDSIQIGITSIDGINSEFAVADSPDGATVWSHAGKYTGKLNVPVSVERVNGQTVYKFYIPFEKLGVKYTSGQMLRMAFIVNEDDGLDRIRWIEWFKGIGSSKDPNKFGWAILQ
ncbi:MAG: hypothetical protein JXR78_09625 [Victivallales bacterium]|nr:hypothetical protein [Victivallales bacterium]